MESEGSVLLPRLAGQKPDLAPDSTKNFYPLCTSEMSTVMLQNICAIEWLLFLSVYLSLANITLCMRFSICHSLRKEKKTFQVLKGGPGENLKLCTRTLI